MATQELVFVTDIGSPPEAVWAAITDPNFAGHTAFGRDFKGDWTAGATLLCDSVGGSILSSGHILVLDPPRHLRIHWRVERMGELTDLPGTTVSYEIQPYNGGSRLTVIESYDEPVEESYLEGGRHAWPLILGELKSQFETARPQPGEPGSAVD
jgi:uncharacterized protein YndB with AHSA1/START domain